ncbi:MAG: hypothetical protein QM724_05895 [Flavobacteriales bacterium]
MGASRWIRVALAALFLIIGAVERKPVALLAGCFFGLQALFNVGCCGTACIPRRSAASTDTPEVIYEELQ